MAGRYGRLYEEVNEYLDEAKTWYNKTRPQSKALVGQAEQKRAQLEEKLGDAGATLAKKK